MEELMRELISIIENGFTKGIYEWVSLIVPIVLSIINVWVVNDNTNKQIKNQNKETYRPRLNLKSINVVENENDKRHLYACSKEYQENKNKISLFVELELENIGNGIANDISFYMLTNGKKCLGIQNEIKDTHQELNSTLEIQKEQRKSIKFLFNFYREKVSNEDEIFDNNDAILLICNYKDLNNNNYKILIGCILKKYEPLKLKYTENFEIDKIYNDAKFSIYYYQEETEAYKRMIESDIYKKFYNEIIQSIV